MAEPTINNSAGRLHRLFVDSLGKSGTGLTIWKDVFGIADADDELELEVALRIREARLLTFDVERELRQIPDVDVDVYVATLPDFRRVLKLEYIRAETTRMY